MLQLIERTRQALPTAERRVADWVLEHPRQAAEATLAVVADACRSSEPTVIRFCRRLGLSGFRELSLRLTEALSRPDEYIHRAVQASDSSADAALKVTDAAIHTLLALRSRLSTLPIDATVALLHSARQIAFAGLGASGHVAADACHKFFRMGKPCTTLTDEPTILQFAATARRADVLLLVSASGRWPVLERAAQTASARGAGTVAITTPDTGLARAAALVLTVEAHEDTGTYTPTSSRLAHLALLDVLFVALALAAGEDASDTLRRSKEILAQPALATLTSARTID